MKKILWLLLTVIIGIVGTYYYLTLAAVETADNFFKAIKENNISKAENYLSEKFKKNTPRSALIRYLNNYHIVDYQKIQWSYKRTLSIKDQGKSAKLEGIIIDKQGAHSPLIIHLDKENGKWKIFAIQKILTDAEKKEQKLLAQYTQLARIPLHNLGIALNDNNMSEFYETISDVWKKETSAKELNKTYGLFKEKGVNLLALDRVVPQLTHASINKQKILTLAGYYDLGKNRLTFKEKYLLQKTHWKLVGLSIEIK